MKVKSLLKKHRKLSVPNLQQVLILKESEIDDLRATLETTSAAFVNLKNEKDDSLKMIFALEQAAQGKQHQYYRAKEECEALQARNQELESQTAAAKEDAQGWKARATALYDILLEELENTHADDTQGLAEIRESLRQSFGVHFD